MAVSDTARKNHDELFPGHVSTLATTDPELIEAFDNFAFDEILQHGNLDTRSRLMVQLAAMIAGQAVSEYRVMLGAALTVGVTPIEAKEVVYQAVPYVGMARVFDFLHATNDVLAERGVELPLPGQSTITPHTRAAQGLAVQKRIVRRRPGRRIWRSVTRAEPALSTSIASPAAPSWAPLSPRSTPRGYCASRRTRSWPPRWLQTWISGGPTNSRYSR
jgi:alkylhydroperoxidase/carboxymuconolactone decarboxylase family protein YurZ